jgi:hypothetical protein
MQNWNEQETQGDNFCLFYVLIIPCLQQFIQLHLHKIDCLEACPREALYQYLAFSTFSAHFFSPIPNHEHKKMDNTKSETIQLPPPGPIIIVG